MLYSGLEHKLNNKTKPTLIPYPRFCLTRELFHMVLTHVT